MSSVLPTDPARALGVLVLCASRIGKGPSDLQLYFLKKNQILECLDQEGCSGRGLDSSSHFLNSLQGFPLCVCVLNLSCIMQKCVFLNFFHSGHENYAFLTCFLISVAIFLIQMISMDREFTQQIALGLDLVVNLYPVLP